jgi:hypothetical protein
MSTAGTKRTTKNNQQGKNRGKKSQIKVKLKNRHSRKRRKY